MLSRISSEKPRSRHRRPAPLVALALACGLIALVVAVALDLAASPSARAAHTSPASGDGTILVSPPAGGPGVSLSLQVRIYTDAGGSYELRDTTVDPAQGGCSSAQPFPVDGLNPFRLDTQPTPGTITFTWPSAVGSGRYYFCVFSADAPAQTPASGTPAATATPTTPPQYSTGERAHSVAPFTLARDATPQVGISGPMAGVPLGSIMGIQINDWQSSDHQPPTHVWMVTPDGFSWYDLQLRAMGPPDSNGVMTLKVTLPSSLPYPLTQSESFFLVAGGAGIYQYSAPFQVIPVPGATATATTPSASPTVTVVTPRQVSSTDSSGPSLLIYALSGLTLLIALGLVAVVVVLALRGRSDTRQRALSQMGLDVEPLEAREPASVHATIRLSEDNPLWRDERDEWGDDPRQPPAHRSARPSTHRPTGRW